ncbi:MAG TPA: ComEA family DNA-binding protein [Pseudonocardiaceae bacterium]|nr:ComEA family DNA-binding protein [Pseudonocardiaceae bacterium]
MLTKPKYTNPNSRDNVRDRLAGLAGELASETRATARNADEPIPVFTWPRIQDPDPDMDVVDVELTNAPQPHTNADDAPAELDPSPIESTSGDPPTPDLFADTRAGPAGQLVERWLPGGHRALDGARSLLRRHRGPTLAVVVIALVAAIVAGVAMASSRPETEAAPALPPAVSAMANSSSVAPRPANIRIVISVVGKVANPGLVTLTDGARVADAVAAAGGVLPGTDVTELNLARKLADGEQIYVGIPVPPAAADPPPDPAVPSDAGSAAGPAKKSKKGKTATQLEPGQKVDLNTASANDLESLPGVGDATAQRIVTWRSQHGSFNSIDQLRDVGGIGDGKFTKLKDLVTV